jgi:hypothetical protein
MPGSGLCRTDPSDWLRSQIAGAARRHNQSALRNASNSTLEGHRRGHKSA